MSEQVLSIAQIFHADFVSVIEFPEAMPLALSTCMSLHDQGKSSTYIILITGFFPPSQKNLRMKTQNSRKKLRTQGKNIIFRYFLNISKAYVSKARLSNLECRTKEKTQN